MLTRQEEFVLRVFLVLVEYMGNDPRVYSLYFTCKTLYGKFLIKREAKTGMERFLNLGGYMDIALSCLQRVKVKNFFKALFNGYIVCDMIPLYAIFDLPNGRHFRIPLPLVRYFYLVLLENGEFRVRKYNFYHKMNVISMNKSKIGEWEEGEYLKKYARTFMCVSENYKVHSDSFILGCKFKENGVMLTSNFSLGEINFFGVTCYPSFREWVESIDGLNYELLKRFFCYPAFRNQVMAMFQCVKCFKFLRKMLIKMTLGRSVPSNFDAFHVFKSKVKFNPTKVVKHVNMSEEFYNLYSYTEPETISKPLNHLNNGELLHDCCYDVEGSDIKLVFFNAFKCIKIYGNNKVLSSPHFYEFSS